MGVLQCQLEDLCHAWHGIIGRATYLQDRFATFPCHVSRTQKERCLLAQDDTNRPVRRSIQRVWTVERQQQGPGHQVGLVLEPGRWAEYDPFLLLAEDWFEQGTFDVHPHRGQETVTYVIDGVLNHYDSKAGEGQLGPGDVQWMTAGRGVVHKEDPAPGVRVHSLQLWVNLPRASKFTEPRYQNLRGADMPVRREPGAEIRVFSGSSGGVQAPTKNHVPVTMVEINLQAGATVLQDLPGDFNGFVYVLAGRGRFGVHQVEAEAGQALLLGPGMETEPSATAEPHLRIESGNDDVAHAESVIEVTALTPLRALLYAGRPLHEPVVQYGPFVMNTRAEILQAFEDYQNGRFVD
ncbi:MAG: pirin family protein [Alicyclobacillus sp.]|nr:pirin family protein [Alicyclobacillus sp.]